MFPIQRQFSFLSESVKRMLLTDLAQDIPHLTLAEVQGERMDGGSFL